MLWGPPVKNSFLYKTHSDLKMSTYQADFCSNIFFNWLIISLYNFVWVFMQFRAHAPTIRQNCLFHSNFLLHWTIGISWGTALMSAEVIPWGCYDFLLATIFSFVTGVLIDNSRLRIPFFFHPTHVSNSINGIIIHAQQT